jgi:hypothetical protein
MDLQLALQMQAWKNAAGGGRFFVDGVLGVLANSPMLRK